MDVHIARRVLDEGPEIIHALAIERATPAALARLSASLELSPWASARAQCKRRLAGGLTAHRGQPFGWSGLPQGLSLLASNDNVLDLARDGELLFSGHPWGVAVYGVDGTPRIRVPLATAACTFVSISLNNSVTEELKDTPE